MNLEVRLPVFEGPMDLLLHLIRKNEIDIYDIPIYEITLQYLEYLKEWNRQDMEIASEFIVMAATLINIKARMLLPSETPEEEEEDPRDDLIRHLLEYQRYKEAAEQLKSRLPDLSQLFIERAPEKIVLPRIIPPVSALLSGVQIDQLYELFRMVLQSKRDSIDQQRSSFKAVAHDTYSIEEKIDDLLERLCVLQQITYQELCRKSSSRQEKITYFLAMLELSRSSRIELEQAERFADILIRPIRTEKTDTALNTDSPEDALPETDLPKGETETIEPEEIAAPEETPVEPADLDTEIAATAEIMEEPEKAIAASFDTAEESDTDISQKTEVVWAEVGENVPMQALIRDIMISDINDLLETDQNTGPGTDQSTNSINMEEKEEAASDERIPDESRSKKS